MKEKILLTGITGFIGNRLAPELRNLGYEIHATIRHKASEDSKSKMNRLENINYHYCNLIDGIAINNLVSNISPDYIIHLGAISPVRNSFENPLEYQHIDYLGTIYLIHAAMNVNNFKKFLFASTMETYGIQKKNKPFTEDLSLNPVSPYAVAKVASEKYLQMANKVFNLPYIALKPCNTYGRLNNTDFITEYLTVSMLKGHEVFLGTPDAVRDMMYVTDHVNAYIKCLNPDLEDGSYNFGWGSELKMLELANKIASKIGFEERIHNKFPSDYPDRPFVEKYLSLDNTKAKEKIGWQPKISLEEGLNKTIHYWKEQLSIE